MDYVLLSPEEAAALLKRSPQDIVALIESGELGGLKVAGQWRVPLKAITQMLATGMEQQTAQALKMAFDDHATWQRVFGAHPEVTQEIEAGEFPVGSVGAYLKDAIANARKLQDEDYGSEDERRA
jgi:excisionase family DNA binding protein